MLSMLMDASHRMLLSKWKLCCFIPADIQPLVKCGTIFFLQHASFFFFFPGLNYRTVP